MKIKKLSLKTDKEKIMEYIGVSRSGIKIMSKKINVNLILIKTLRTPAANILKQEALSIGAEVAVEKDTILCKDQNVDALLIANDRELEILSKKLKPQPFGLKEVAKALNGFIYKSPPKTKIMGIINANSDSFYPKSRFSPKEAIAAIEKMIDDGADIIDIGGVSSRPGSESVSEAVELERVKDIIDAIESHKLYEKAIFSLDSYNPKPIHYALDRGFKIINDITALSNDEVAKLSASYQATVVLMHMKGTPKTMQKNPYYEDVIDEVDHFFKERIERAKAFGVEDIILDVGIGFGKRLKDNLVLLKHLSHFRHFGYELLIGASRKSLIDAVMPTQLEDRLPATLALHQRAVEEGASIVRVHDVLEHKRALSMIEAIDGVLV